MKCLLTGLIVVLGFDQIAFANIENCLKYLNDHRTKLLNDGSWKMHPSERGAQQMSSPTSSHSKGFIVEESAGTKNILVYYEAQGDTLKKYVLGAPPQVTNFSILRAIGSNRGLAARYNCSPELYETVQTANLPAPVNPTLIKLALATPDNRIEVPKAGTPEYYLSNHISKAFHEFATMGQMPISADVSGPCTRLSAYILDEIRGANQLAQGASASAASSTPASR